MANHATRINRYVDRFGYDKVEEFIDACLSLEDLIDPHSVHIKRPEEIDAVPHAALLRDDDFEYLQQESRFAAKGYMDPFINPPEVLQREAAQKKKALDEKERKRSFPDEPQRDVLLFLLQHAPLKDWQHDILSIIRDEAYYFAPQGQTKIMNEGWACFWHTTLMTRHGLTDAEVIDYADHHSGTMAMSPQRINPYKIGLELFRDIEERWNKGRFGEECDHCDDWETIRKWDKQLGLGREKIFEIRRVHNDITFIDTYLTAEFCRQAQDVFLRLRGSDRQLRDRLAGIPGDQAATFEQPDEPRPAVHLRDGRQSSQPRRAVPQPPIPGNRIEAGLRSRYAGQSA